jgi:hypothetical protein
VTIGAGNRLGAKLLLTMVTLAYIPLEPMKA